MSVADLAQMSRLEKIKLMEAIWADLTRDDADVQAPAWHQDALRETEQRLAAGKEDVVDWAEAKKELRARFE
ncbi:MAG: addiction module protein [Opitutaceae bacterium]